MFALDNYAIVDEIKSFDNRTVVKVHTMDNKGENDYSGFVTLWGDAFEKSVDLFEGCQFKIGKFGVTTKYAKGKWYTNINMYDIDDIGQAEVVDEVEDLPFS